MRSLLALAALAASVSAQLNELGKAAGMKYFGAATDSPGQRERAGLQSAYPTYNAILRNTDEFGQLTPTNGMKWLFTEAEPGVFNFTEGDIVATIAAETGQLLRCHALVWHSQLAPWVDANTTIWTPANLTAAITRHIDNVMAHWKGKCYAWDVVNEALNEDGTYRTSVFYNVLGEDYIPLAFDLASKADPAAKLYYNDYNLESPGPKSRAAVAIVKSLKAKGIKIDGVGMQAHLVANRAPSRQQMLDVIAMYKDAGVETAMTELDVRLDLPVNDTNMAWQKQVYGDAAAACALSTPTCVGITLWDFYDPFSWVPAVFPGQGAPSLWFDNFTVHPAYGAVVDELKAAAASKAAAAAAGMGKGMGRLMRRRVENLEARTDNAEIEAAPKADMASRMRKRMVQHVTPMAQEVTEVRQGSRRAGGAGPTFPGMRQSVRAMAQGVGAVKQGFTGMRQRVTPMAQQIR